MTFPSVADRRQISFISLAPFLLMTFGLAWGILALFILLPDRMNAIFGELSGGILSSTWRCNRLAHRPSLHFPVWISERTKSTLLDGSHERQATPDHSAQSLLATIPFSRRLPFFARWTR